MTVEASFRDKILAAIPNQQAHLAFEDFRYVLAQLPIDQCEALLLVGTQRLSYEEAAEVCNTAVGDERDWWDRRRVSRAPALTARCRFTGQVRGRR